VAPRRVESGWLAGPAHPVAPQARRARQPGASPTGAPARPSRKPGPQAKWRPAGPRFLCHGHRAMRGI
jgi:hypothetical protein